MPRAIRLWDEKNGEGVGKSFEVDMPTLPPEIDAKAESLSVVREAIPVVLYDQPNYGGNHVQLIRAGGCDDLANLPGGGNWANRIRSFKSKVPTLSESEVQVELPDAPRDIGL
ncbi:hypothetical protein ABIF65_000251 [Bradyrhizobium japonicum]|uniref:peptidase inhibitor family I36 protein n=1 Tax=Bradyrhizobium TaxID=374 RepID=UPI0012BCD3DB|nr:MULTISPECIES: peptidase inhibitor family I36 protein [Bradyrhizobium]MBR0884480.1 hypothetical protein [Bradyrhizobium liaoningense]MBR1004825.1 hypothetical protein [Bradyrhizobium liaoningense]MBR1071151.1 hypothetical protein [Bradyrhizobium liaoningense]MCP1738786.1 hypothetical protein [Bradyrhizobium japonicum]MCP1776974.1 hypothetical protein [Bradyrhizobium japonicum]